MHRELPFSLAHTAREWLEGVMDLALFDPAADAWLLLDWKTNFVTPQTAASLRELASAVRGGAASGARKGARRPRAAR